MHTTLFYQGNSSSRGQAAQYTLDSVSCRVGEQIKVWRCRSPAAILKNIAETEELDDIGYAWGWNPIHWGQKLLRWALQRWRGIEGPVHIAYPTMWSLASSADRQQCKAALAEIAQHDQDIVLFGCSRGAATVFATVCELAAEHSPLLERVKLVLLEAPFDSVQSVLQASAWFPELQYAALRWSRFEPTLPSPLQLAKHFPKNLPVGFVTSKVDSRVPTACTQRLVEVLLQSGHSALHTLELEHSSHPNFTCDNTMDRQRYEAFVAKLYAQYL